MSGTGPYLVNQDENSGAFTPRQRDVLSAALELLVEGGDTLTMTAVARRASCSKETLYKWFGGREGLLNATVQWQAAKVRAPVLDRATLDRPRLQQTLEQFGRDLLTVLSGETSVALNRVAISRARTGGSDLGTIVLENGRHALGHRLKAVLEMGRQAGLLRFADAEEAFRDLFGLVVRDVQIRLLLGEHLQISAARIETDAMRAAKQFMVLHGT